MKNFLNSSFPEIGEKCIEMAKIGGIRNLWSMAKKSSEILADENREIFEER